MICETKKINRNILYWKSSVVVTEQFAIESVESEQRLLSFCFTSLCDWSKRLARRSQPIRCRTKTNHDFVARVFPRFKQFVYFYCHSSTKSVEQLPSSDNLGHWPRVSKVSPSEGQIPRSVPSLLCPPVDLCPQSHSHLVLKCHAFHTSLIWDSKKDNGYGQASSFDREWKLAAHASLDSSFLWLNRAVLIGIVVGAY